MAGAVGTEVGQGVSGVLNAAGDIVGGAASAVGSVVGGMVRAVGDVPSGIGSALSDLKRIQLAETENELGDVAKVLNEKRTLSSAQFGHIDRLEERLRRRSEKTFVCRGVSSAGTAAESQAVRGGEFSGRQRRAVKGLSFSDSTGGSNSVVF
jgi:hypothetical protein